MTGAPPPSRASGEQVAALAADLTDYLDLVDQVTALIPPEEITASLHRILTAAGYSTEEADTPTPCDHHP